MKLPVFAASRVFFGQRSMGKLAAVLCLLPALGGALGCEKEAKKELSEAEKQARVEALLKENGAQVPKGESTTDAAPTTPSSPLDEKADAAQALPEGNEAPAPSSTGKPTPSETAPGAPVDDPSSGESGKPGLEIKLLSAGTGDKKTLRYGFQPSRQRKFDLDMEIAPTRTVNGQAAPGTPPIALTVTGTTRTMALASGRAQREYVFQSVVPSVSGLPPEIAEQMKAQFQVLSGVGLVEEVTDRGKVENMGLKQEVMNPQVLALMQYLTDGMTNAYLPLPEEPVGVGAKWIATTKVENAGLAVTQENTISLTSLRGNEVTVEMTYKQSAPSQEVKSPNLPPGVKVEVVGLDGSGTGKMRVDLAKFEVDAKVDLSMKVDTRITQPGAPGPLTESGTTKMRAHVRVTP